MNLKQRDKIHDIITYRIQKYNEFIHKNRNRDFHRNKFMLTKGEIRRGINRSCGDNIKLHYYIKKINNKALLYSIQGTID